MILFNFAFFILFPSFFALLLSKLNINLKAIVFLFLIICSGLDGNAQNLYLKISGKSETEDKIINKIGYNSINPNGKSIVDEINLMSNRLTKMGYLENKIIENKKSNDSTYICIFNLNEKTDSIIINISKNKIIANLGLFDSEKETLTLPFSETEDFLSKTLSKLEYKGYALAKVKLINIKKGKNILTADLDLTLEKERQLNAIVIKGYEKFPIGFKQNFNRNYKNTIFNQENLNNLYKDFEKIRFVKQVKYPEILFEKDSTKVYVYLEKAKANSFDGFIGFANDPDGNIIFNGFLDLNMINTLNAGELFTIFWKSDGNNQKVFNAAIELPYMFKSPIALKANLNIYKQDSTFQNTKTAINLGYFLKYNSRLYIGYQSTESSDIQNQNATDISDYQNQFLTTSYEFFDYERDNLLFPLKANISVKFGFGSREAQSSSSKQAFGMIDLDYNFYLNKKNVINVQSQDYYLQSDEYLINELYRFGGVNSIQGFRENSLQGNLFTSILTEYRYIISPNLYINSVIDFGYFQDKSTNNKGDLLGVGLGFGLLTKNGLFALSYTTGSSNDQTLELSNAIVNISFRTKF